MAALTLTLTVESDLTYDAIDALARAREALFSRHGDRFRDLYRDIEALPDADLSDAQLHHLSEGVFVMSPPKALTDLVARARALGVI